MFSSQQFIFHIKIGKNQYDINAKIKAIQIQFENLPYHFASMMGYKVSCINPTTNDSQRFMTEDIVVCRHHN